MEVGGPGLAKQVPQLLVDGVMTGVGHSLGLGCALCWDDILGVAEDELDLQMSTS